MQNALFLSFLNYLNCKAENNSFKVLKYYLRFIYYAIWLG